MTPKTKDQRPKTIRQAGFSLLELMIVLFVIVILATVALPQYQKTIIYAREAVLKDNLVQMRKMIDQYAADKGKRPQSLEELVSAGYLREVPIDPMTDEANWDVRPATENDPYLVEGQSGIGDVKSSSPDTSLDGKPYNEF